MLKLLPAGAMLAADVGYQRTGSKTARHGAGRFKRKPPATPPGARTPTDAEVELARQLRKQGGAAWFTA